MLRRLPCFDCVTVKRLPVLQALLERELDTGELAIRTNKKRKAAYWHILVLLKAGLIEEKITKKHNFSPGAKTLTRDITRYNLSLLGAQAIEYFGNKKEVVK